MSDTMDPRRITKTRMAHRLAIECLTAADDADDGATYEWVVVAEGQGCWMYCAFAAGDEHAAGTMVNKHSAWRHYVNLYTVAEVRMFMADAVEWTDAEQMDCEVVVERRASWSTGLGGDRAAARTRLAAARDAARSGSDYQGSDNEAINGGS